MVSYGVIGWHVASWGVPRESERERGARDGGVSRARATVSLPREHDEKSVRAPRHLLTRRRRTATRSAYARRVAFHRTNPPYGVIGCHMVS